MALELETSGISELDAHIPIVNGASSIDRAVHDVKLFSQPYRFACKVRLTAQTINRPSRPSNRNFIFPIDAPTQGFMEWQMGLVQNVISRYSIATYDGERLKLTDWDNVNILDTMADIAKPFYSDPRDVTPPVRLASTTSGSTPQRQFSVSGGTYFIGSNVTISGPFFRDPWILSQPTLQIAARDTELGLTPRTMLRRKKKGRGSRPRPIYLRTERSP